MFWALPYEVRRTSYRILRPQGFAYLQALRKRQLESEYSLASPEELGCLFVHLPKTGGISIAKALFGDLGGGHLDVGQYLLVYERSLYEKLFKFAFVRNPWDRLVSAFLFLKQGGLNESDRAFAERLDRYSTFEEFVTHWVTPENVQTGSHFRPQLEQICWPGTRVPAMDFIGRFERLHQDFQTVCATLGVTGVELPHKNRTAGKRDYRSYYNDKTRQVVADIYREDAELFGYDFHGTKRAHGPELPSCPDAVGRSWSQQLSLRTY